MATLRELLDTVHRRAIVAEQHMEASEKTTSPTMYKTELELATIYYQQTAALAQIIQAEAMVSITESLDRIADALYDDTGNVAINLDMIARAVANVG